MCGVCWGVWGCLNLWSKVVVGGVVVGVVVVVRSEMGSGGWEGMGGEGGLRFLLLGLVVMLLLVLCAGLVMVRVVVGGNSLCC